MLILLLVISILGEAVVSGSDYLFSDPHFDADKYGIVHLFEWHWSTIAEECETFLSQKKVGGVQISPPNENRVLDSRPWYERYQPVSYILTTRSGDRAAFKNMVDRCNAVGVRIYADIVINHMAQESGEGKGTAGSYFNTKEHNFPAVPYSSPDFNDYRCSSTDGTIQNYGDVNQVRNCRLNNLLDLNQEKEWVRDKIVGFMNDMISLGVAGFRIDASKHMWPGDLKIIYGRLNNLTSEIYGEAKRPYIFQEVIDQGGEPIKATDYSQMAPVTEFKYGMDLSENRMKLQYLYNVGEKWGMLPSDQALVFLNNHDNQRGHGGGGDIVTFKNDYDLKILTAYMLAYPYGTPRVMSSYSFTSESQGPPPSQRSVNADGSCGNGWICEHRWRQIANMFEFSAVVKGASFHNWWSNAENRFAFSRGNKGFIAVNKNGEMNENINTGLPDGHYCDVISGSLVNGSCAGSCVTVTNGVANIAISNRLDRDQVLALHVNARVGSC